MFQTEPVLVLPLISLLVLAVFISVFLVLYCIDCGKQSKYERLDRKYVESRDSEVQQRKQIEKQRQEAWSDAQYYARSLPKSKLMSEYDLWEMGFRRTRTNFLIKFDDRVSLLSLVEPGQGCAFPFTSEPSRAMFREIMVALKHPFIQPLSKSDFWIEQSKSVTITYFSDEGSIRDIIHNAKPTAKWDLKYESANKVRTLDKKKIAEYGRQILEALIFMKECGIPYTHLHAGNVIIKSDIARITNIENGLLNLERQQERLYRQFAKKSPTKFGKLDLDTISFGALLYEMATGYPLKNLSQLDNLAIIKDLLEVVDLIFKDADKNPSLEELIQLPLFANVKLKNFTKPVPVQFDEKKKNTLTAARYESKQLQGLLKSTSNRATKSTSPRAPKRTLTATSPSTPTTTTTTTTTTPTRAPTTGPQTPASTVARPQSVASPVAATKSVPPPPPAAGPPAPGPPPPPPPSVAIPAPQDGRNELLSSIRGFSGKLRKAKTVDKSAPKI